MDTSRKTFVGMNEKRIAHEILRSKKQVFYASPGIFQSIAEAIIQTQMRNQITVDVIIDPDPEICRLGYGELIAEEKLLAAGISLRKASNMRICLLIVDDSGWLFNLPPLCVEASPDATQINGICLSEYQIMEMIDSLGLNFLYDEKADQKAKAEIGKEQVSIHEIEFAKKDLLERPPEQFDITRKINVYHAHVQFVEIHLDGCEIERHKVKIPPKFSNLSWGKELNDRIETNLSIINDTAILSTNSIRKRFERLKKEFLRSVGGIHGNVILKKNKTQFEKGIRDIEAQIKQFQEKQIDNVNQEFKKTKKLILQQLLPAFVKKPPEDMKFSFIFDASNKQDIEKYLEDCIGSA